MIDLQIAVTALMTLLLNGGVDAAKELVKGVAVNGAEAASKVWREIFAEKPESLSLADRVANNPQDSETQQRLRGMLEEVFAQRPELLQQMQQIISIGEVKAERGSAAVGVMKNSTIDINNR